MRGGPQRPNRGPVALLVTATVAVGGLGACGRLPAPPPEALAHAAARASATTSAAAPVAPPSVASALASAQPAAAVTSGAPLRPTLAGRANWTGRLPAGAMAVTAARDQPVRVRVGVLAIDAPVVAAGVAPDGQLQLPEDAATVAWFGGGAVPGHSGSAVLAAHVDFGGAPGAFFSLADLPAGSAIEVDFADGSTRAFRTDGRARALRKADLPVVELFRRGGEASLTLVTCGGAFDPVARSYAENTLVTASPA